MIQIVEKNIVNLFGGTDPAFKVQGSIAKKRRMAITRTMAQKLSEERDKLECGLFITENAGDKNNKVKVNPYESVAHLIPK